MEGSAGAGAGFLFKAMQAATVPGYEQFGPMVPTFLATQVERARGHWSVNSPGNARGLQLDPSHLFQPASVDCGAVTRKNMPPIRVTP
jgi:hypothetical protein